MCQRKSSSSARSHPTSLQAKTAPSSTSITQTQSRSKMKVRIQLRILNSNSRIHVHRNVKSDWHQTSVKTADASEPLTQPSKPNQAADRHLSLTKIWQTMPTSTTTTLALKDNETSHLNLCTRPKPQLQDRHALFWSAEPGQPIFKVASKTTPIQTALTICINLKKWLAVMWTTRRNHLWWQASRKVIYSKNNRHLRIMPWMTISSRLSKTAIKILTICSISRGNLEKRSCLMIQTVITRTMGCSMILTRTTTSRDTATNSHNLQDKVAPI